jgi:hypothetical protein
MKREVDTSNVSDTIPPPPPPPKSLKKEIFPTKERGKYGKVKVYKTVNYRNYA